MNRTAIQFALVSLLALRGGTSAANEYWVSPNGAACYPGDPNCGTGPCSGPTAGLIYALASTHLQAGDLVHVCDGTYSGAFAPAAQQHGSPNLPIVFRAEHPLAAIIDGSTAQIGRGNAIMSFSNWSYVTFDGFLLQHSTRLDGGCDTAIDCQQGRCIGGNGFVFYGGSHHIIIQNVKIFDVCQAGVQFTDSSNSTLQNSEVSFAVRENVGRIIGNGAAGVGTYCSICGSNINILNNNIHDVYSECLTLGMNGALVKNNRLYNCFHANLYLDTANNVTIQNNYIFNLRDVCGTLEPPGCNCNQPPPNPTPGCFYHLDHSPADGISLSNESNDLVNRPGPLFQLTFYNNVVDNTRYGLFWWVAYTGSPYDTYHDIVFSNNIIKTSVKPVCIQALPRTSNPAYSNKLENNVIFGAQVSFETDIDCNAPPNPNPIAWCPAGGGSINNNLFKDSPVLPTCAAANLLSSDPLLCSPNELDHNKPTVRGYFIGFGSPAVGAGVFELRAPTDYEGNPRAPPALVNIGINQSTICELLSNYPPYAVKQSNNIDVFRRTSNDTLSHKSFTGGAWFGAEEMGGSLASEASPVVSSPGVIDVFWKGSDGNLWHKWHTDQWYGPQSLGMGPLGSAPHAVGQSNGTIDVFWIGTDGQLWHGWYSSGWFGPEPMGGSLASEPSPVVSSPGVIDVFWKGSDGNLWHKWHTDQWYGPQSLGMGPLGSAPQAAAQNDGSIEVFWSGTDARLWHARYNGSWFGPEQL